MRRDLFLLAALAAVPVPLAAQQAASPPSRAATTLPPIPKGRLGYTFCRDGLVETWIRADIVGTPVGEEILAHEAVHRLQARAFPTCEAWQASLSTARRVIDAELPAYCAQFRLVLARGGGVDADSLRWDYTLRISAESGAMENRLDVRERLRRECPA